VRRLLELLLIWLADAVDRSLLTVPEVDVERPPPAGCGGEHAPVVAPTSRPPLRGHQEPRLRL
jgi:hypothetical protein